jgi:hypothetical protein
MATTLILDDFTVADGTLINGRTPSPTNTPGNNWVSQFGTMTVTANQMGPISSGTARSAIDAGVSDCTVSANLTHGTSNVRNPGLLLRANTSTSGAGSGSTSHWVAALVAGTGVVLVERNAGSDTIRASSAKTITTSTTYLVAAVLNGANIDVYVDGVLECSYASATFQQSNTRHGILGYGTSPVGIVFDDFKVETLDLVAGQPIVKRFGGVPFASRIPNVW